MAKNTESAKRIIEAVGGPSNIKHFGHCATRLRFELKDTSKIDKATVEAIPGVLAAVDQGDNSHYQVVIGGGVDSMYTACADLPEMKNVATSAEEEDGEMTDAEVKAAAREAGVRGKHPWLNAFFEYLSDSFRPIIGVLLGASLIIALINLAISLGWVTGEESSATMLFLKALRNGVFYFLPIMVAYNASKKLKADGWVGAAIMAALLTPQFQSLGKATTTLTNGKTATLGDAVTCTTNATLNTQSCTTKVFGLPMLIADYSGNVFVPLLMAAVLGLVWWALKKIIPDSVQLVFVPFLSLVIVGLLTAYLIGPIGTVLGNWLGLGLAWLNTHAPFIFAIAIPLLYPFLVPLGLHWPLNALMLMNINSMGYDFIQGPMGVWNFACFGATAGVLLLSIRDKDSDTRQTAIGALAAGLLGGVSEPSLYGIHLRNKLVYPRMLIGCGVGGVVIAVLGWLFPSTVASGQVVHGVTTTAFAFTSLLTIPVFSKMWVYAISIAVAFLTAMALVYFLDYVTPEERAAIKAKGAKAAVAAAAGDATKAAKTAATSAAAAAGSAAAAVEGAAAAESTTDVKAPIAGHVISLEESGDKVFASKALGEGVAIQPTDSTVVAPVAGTLKTVAKTGHAFGIKTDDGVEVLVHVGIDTVKMDGDGFEVAVKKGDHVNVGDKLGTVDLDKVKAAGYATTTIVAVSNTKALAKVTPTVGKDVKAGDPIIAVEH